MTDFHKHSDPDVRSFGSPEMIDNNFWFRTVRRWLERLLTRITYVSSLENDPLIIVDARRQMSQVNSPHFGAFNQLQEVLFYKLKSQKEWDFSFVLEQLQVAETLRT